MAHCAEHRVGPCNTDWYGGIRKRTVEVICFLGPVYRRMHIVRSTGWEQGHREYYGMGYGIQ